ncbi:thiopurine S-methyltransferase, partial [Reticulomyxa filosa]
HFLYRENIAYCTLDHSYNFTYDPKSRRSLPVYETQHLTLVNGSIFDETVVQYLGENSIDLVYDVDALSIINPSERQAYVDVLLRLLKKPRGRILLHCYDYPPLFSFTHPYPIDQKSVAQLFGYWCHYRRIACHNIDSTFFIKTRNPESSKWTIKRKDVKDTNTTLLNNFVVIDCEEPKIKAFINVWVMSAK